MQLDGKSYAFFGGSGTYVVDGTTFVIDGDSVTVQRPGEAELVLPLETCADDATVAEGASPATSEVTITTAAEDAVVAQYSQSALSEDEFSPEAFSVYAPFGLSCDPQTDALTFMGRAVRNFLDVRSSNGAALTGGYGEVIYDTLPHAEAIRALLSGGAVPQPGLGRQRTGTVPGAEHSGAARRRLLA